MIGTPFQQNLLRQISLICPVYVVGGAVRDSLLQRPGADLDAVTPLPLPELERVLHNLGYPSHRLGTHKQTVTLFNDRERIDLLQLSSGLDQTEQGGAVAPDADTIAQDAGQRDFTVNAIYYDVRNDCLLDPLGGRADLAAGLLRACGSAPERFREDPARILRLVRLAVQYRLEIEGETWQAAKEAVPRLEQVAPERTTAELGRILVLDQVTEALRMLDKLNYWDAYLPELARLKGLTQNQYHTKDAWEHTLQVVANTPPRLLLRLAALLHDIGKWETASRECRAWGKLVRKETGYYLNSFKITGKGLEPWAGSGVEILGGRLDHDPRAIVLKKIRARRGGQGFEWVPEGKRQFLNHERESARLVKGLLPRFRWSMVLHPARGKGEETLVNLIKNHMLGTLTFMKELREGEFGARTGEKCRKLAWELGWDGRVYDPAQVEDFLQLWRADFFGGKARAEENGERFEAIQTQMQDTAAEIDCHWQNIEWTAFNAFAAEKTLSGPSYGHFKEQVRRAAVLKENYGLDNGLLTREYHAFSRGNLVRENLIPEKV